MAEWLNYDKTTFTDFGTMGETVPVEEGGIGGDGSTMPVDGGMGASPYAETEPDTDAMSNDPWNNMQETIFNDPELVNGSGQSVRPATGWLVCIEGPTKGVDYRLYSGYTYIGRDAAKNQVAIPDQHISSEPSARILYDVPSRKFFINETNGARNPVYLNGNLFDGRVELKAYDMIKLGNTSLLFVPLCTEKFAWEDKED